jgi:hypothetical protein
MSAPAYPAAVTGYAPMPEETAAILWHRRTLAYNPSGRDCHLIGALDIALAVAEANRAAAEAAHWSRELAAPRPVEEPLRHLSEATRAECAKVAADAEPLARIGQGDCERTIPAE